ncbi:Zinc-finger of the MIZ type in Nse subunit [Seminavis robusta]|uniref:Zinc-finger of the MIZ type in Nse subunit n=1 Tax=Seminavis robusta TaxID=568900 RepID=A0A9N8DWX1_9STRA|nr:Zinc-finger of the MIZ type in Nse subunit [Seminavis robusta]|eukprot:Sro406_g136480.1 Zinc-finger of the MIZ type in Nse subunit (251) ;mRNA; f:58703-59455
MQGSTTNNAAAVTMNDLLAATQNLATIDKALGDIRRLLEAKASLEADVQALKLEKARLAQEVSALRNEQIDASSVRASSLPDLHFDYDDDSSSSDDSEEELTHSERKAKAPERFVCPLTLEIMNHPMLQKGTKNNYERGAILEWIYFGKATCPLTRRKLHPGDFVLNEPLQREIEQWREKYDMQDESAQEEDMDSSELVPTLTPEEEQRNQKRLSLVQTKRNGSTKNLMGLRERILRKRDARVERRMSQR